MNRLDDDRARHADPAPGRGRAVVIVTFFGTFGRWFPLFLHSLGQQRCIDLLLVTDAVNHALPGNARHLKATLAEVRDRAADVLRVEVNIPRPRKLCDLKPAYGLMFEEFLTGYDYWGYGDEDVLYGDLDRLLPPLLDRGADLIVPSRTATIGHLTLVRNAPPTNALVTTGKDFAAALASDGNWAYDEWGQERGGDCGSFTRTVNEAEGRGEIRVERGLTKRGDVPWAGRSYVYDGRAIRDDDGLEIAYYHWGRLKGRGHAFPRPDQFATGFGFDRYGF